MIPAKDYMVNSASISAENPLLFQVVLGWNGDEEAVEGDETLGLGQIGQLSHLHVLGYDRNASICI